MAERVPINLQVAQKIIDVNQDHWQGGLSPFLQEVGKNYNEQTGQSIDWQVLRLRINSGALSCKIQPGKRGRKPGQTLSPQHKAALQEGRKTSPSKAKISTSDLNKKAFQTLIDRYGKKYPKLVAGIMKGSKVAAIKLHCLQCVCEVKKEITNCICFSCPLHSFRPYQHSEEKDDGVEE